MIARSLAESANKNDDLRDLYVYGYQCKLFRDDERALFIDRGKHLIPWMGNDSLMIDRFNVPLIHSLKLCFDSLVFVCLICSVRDSTVFKVHSYVTLGLSNLCRDAETTPRQREPRDAATDAETRTISDSIDRSLMRDACDCDYCDYYDTERLMMIARHGNYWCSVASCLGVRPGTNWAY